MELVEELESNSSGAETVSPKRNESQSMKNMGYENEFNLKRVAVPKIRLSKIQQSLSNAVTNDPNKTESMESFNIYKPGSNSTIADKGISQLVVSTGIEKFRRAVRKIKWAKKFNVENYRKAISLVRSKRNKTIKTMRKQNTAIFSNSKKSSQFLFDEDSIQKLKKQPSILKTMDLNKFVNRFSIREATKSDKKRKKSVRKFEGLSKKQLKALLKKAHRENVKLKAENETFRKEKKTIETKLETLNKAFTNLENLNNR